MKIETFSYLPLINDEQLIDLGDGRHWFADPGSATASVGIAISTLLNYVAYEYPEVVIDPTTIEVWVSKSHREYPLENIGHALVVQVETIG